MGRYFKIMGSGLGDVIHERSILVNLRERHDGSSGSVRGEEGFNH